MKPIVYSQRSLQDIEGILEFISRDKPEASLRFVENILQQCDLLSSAPTLGEKRHELLPDLRYFASEITAFLSKTPEPRAHRTSPAWSIECLGA